MKIHSTARLEGRTLTSDFEVRKKDRDLYALLQPIEGVGWLVAELDPGKIQIPGTGSQTPIEYKGLIGTEGNPARRVPFDFFA